MSLRSDVLALVALFNRQKIDLPDGVVDRSCVLRLNGRAYHEQLGRPPQDPLVRLIGCGPAGYRFVLGALRHALQDPRLMLHESSVHDASTDSVARLQAQGTLAGRLRGADTPFTAELMLEVSGDGAGHIVEIAATLGDADVELLLDARRRG